MRGDHQINVKFRRFLVAVITLFSALVFSDSAMALGGGGHGGGHGGGGRGGGHGEVESHRSGGHGGGGFDFQRGRHGSIVRGIPHGSLELSHRWNQFFFHEGRFFSRHHDGFIVVAAPIGVIVPRLPDTILRIDIGGVPFYSADGNFYRRTDDGFIAVEAPY